MYVITGITGQVGGILAHTLLSAGQRVRAVVRDSVKAQAWAEEGCDIAITDMSDVAALTKAFTGAQAVFILLPPNFDPSPDFVESRRIIATLRTALEAAAPERIVALSTIGAQAQEVNLLTQLQIMEQQLQTLAIPITFLRAGWFMENAKWDIDAARQGVISSFLQPASHAINMVSVSDVGRVAAELLQEEWHGIRVIELTGPQRISPDDIAACFSRILGRHVVTKTVPPADWENLFRSQGMNNPVPRMQMLEGFNQGWIKFEGDDDSIRQGAVTLETALRAIVGEVD